MARRGEGSTKKNMFSVSREAQITAKKGKDEQSVESNDKKPEIKPEEASKAAEITLDTEKKSQEVQKKSKKQSSGQLKKLDLLFPEKEKSGPVSLYLDADVKRFIAESSKKYNRSKSELVNQIIRSYMS